MPDGSGLGLPADSVCEVTATSSSKKACACLVGSVLRHISPYPDSTRGSNGNADAVEKRLERGLVDFALMIEPVNVEKYDHLALPVRDTVGVIVGTRSP